MSRTLCELAYISWTVQDTGYKHKTNIVEKKICNFFYFNHFDLRGHLEGQIELLRSKIGELAYISWTVQERGYKYKTNIIEKKITTLITLITLTLEVIYKVKLSQ